MRQNTPLAGACRVFVASGIVLDRQRVAWQVSELAARGTYIGTSSWKYGAERIDLLILDLNMPVKNGWATLEWLAEVNPLLPVMIITGRPNQRALAETAGADALMEKPLDVPLLLQTVRELMDEPMESRARRASHRASGSRYMPSDNQPFDEMLLKCCMTPSPLPESKET